MRSPLQHKNSSPAQKQSLSPGKSLAAPTFQLKSKDPKTAKKTPFSTGSVHEAPDLSKHGSLALYKEAIKLQSQFTDPETHRVDKFKIARTLKNVFDILQERSLPHVFDKEHDREDEIWNVYGGYGDPLMGQLELFSPFNQIEEWKSAVTEMDPRAWDDKALHKSYLGNRGHAKATRGGVGVEEVRAKIGSGEKGHMPLIKSGTAHDQDRKEAYAKAHPGKQLTTAVQANSELNLDVDDLFFILGKKSVWDMVNQVTINLEDHRTDLNMYLDHIKKAIRIAKIDTIQGQASYIAHAAGEMLFSKLSEGQSTAFQNDPQEINYLTGANGPLDYSSGGSLSHARHAVDPLNLMQSRGHMQQISPEQRTEIINQTFIGRGPVQVTNDYGYVRSLIVLEELAKTTEDPKDADLIWKAISDIKKDPSAAAKPEYTFLFSAAFMHHNKGLTRSGNLGEKIQKMDPNAAGMDPNQKNLLDWVSGGINYPVFRRKGKNPRLEKSVFDAANHKIEAYNRAFERIKAKRTTP